jgi:hypothetical protein
LPGNYQTKLKLALQVWVPLALQVVLQLVGQQLPFFPHHPVVEVVRLVAVLLQ